MNPKLWACMKKLLGCTYDRDMVVNADKEERMLDDWSVFIQSAGQSARS